MGGKGRGREEGKEKKEEKGRGLVKRGAAWGERIEKGDGKGREKEGRGK